MSLTPSNMLPLGTKAPAFLLPDVISRESKSLQELASNVGTVIMFICNHCPFVKHVNHELVRLAQDYQDQGISFIAISSNDVDNYPQDAPEFMIALALDEGYTFPYLHDETQEVAKAYQAACTPDFYLFNGKLNLTYRGQLDDSRPGNQIAVTGKDLRQALNQTLKGLPIPELQTPSVGCNIKWK